MNVDELLQRHRINPNEPILSITIDEALSNLLEAIKEYCPNLKIDEMTKEELMALLHSYANCIINYHPENHHQERAALLEHFEMLRRYGLTEDDYSSLDFC